MIEHAVNGCDADTGRIGDVEDRDFSHRRQFELTAAILSIFDVRPSNGE
jgi:hypothetical protein